MPSPQTMPRPNHFSLIVAVNDRKVLSDNLLTSPCLKGERDYDLFLQEGFPSAAAAYNDAIARAQTDLLIFVHQDVILPGEWLARLRDALNQLEQNDPEWGVLGCSGVTGGGQFRGRVYTSGVGVIGDASSSPVSVQTLDEIVLIVRKASGLHFDPMLPNFHLYGTDICLRATRMGRINYVFDGFCIHNTRQIFILPEEFYECCKHIRKVWKDQLPIQTTCIRLTSSNIPVITRRLREFYMRHVRRKKSIGIRSENVVKILGRAAGTAERGFFQRHAG